MSSDEYRIDSHKLMFHPKRVARWLDSHEDWNRSKEIYPIYIELSPTGACNHRCVFCALDYMGYKPNFLNIDVFKERLPEMARRGVKSIMLGGEGEPLLYRHINELTRTVHKTGIDVALTTNGVLLNDNYSDVALECLTWMKVSLNAGTAETYAKIHRTNPKDFYTVIKNLKNIASMREKRNSQCTLGVQCLLLSENADELDRLVRICRDDIGADYFVVKPYSQHSLSHTHRYEHIDYGNYSHLSEKLETYNSSRFSVIFRSNTIKKSTQNKPYNKCNATPFFWAYITSTGDVYSCSAYLGDERFYLGNLVSSTFKEIWEGKRRQNNCRFVQRELDISRCRKICRMDTINHYLWELSHQHKHINFI